MASQRLVVVGALVAEQRVKALQPGGVVADQPVPIIVAELVAEMAEQRAVVLAHLGAHLLALGGIGLGDVERDQPVVVAGQHALAGRRAADEGSARKSKAMPISSLGLALGPTGRPKASSE